MGRRWMHGKGGHGNNGGNGDGKNTKNDMSSCRGYCAVLATCEAAREREASKELATLLLQEIEKIDAENAANNNTTNNDNTNTTSSKSIQSLLEEELEEIRGQRHEGTQQIMSVKTGCKGLVLCKIKNRSLCPIDLVKRIFNRVKSEKQPISRWVSRIIPLSHVFYPNEFELDTNIRLVLEEKFPGIILAPQKEFETDKKAKADDDNDNKDSANVNNNTDNTQDINSNTDINDEIVGEKRTVDESHANNDVDSNDNTKRTCVEDPYANKPPTYYALQFKQRNHTVVSKNMTFESLKRNCPPFIKASFKYDMKVHFNLIVEVFMNLGGITYIDGNDELISADFNLRRLQTQLFGQPPEKVNPNPPKKGNNPIDTNPPKNETIDTNPTEKKTTDNESNEN